MHERTRHTSSNAREPGHNREALKRQFAVCVTVGIALTVVFVGGALGLYIGLARRARPHAGTPD